MALKVNDLRGLDIAELEKKAKEIAHELIFERGPKRRSLRKSLARVLTVLAEKLKKSDA